MSKLFCSALLVALLFSTAARADLLVDREYDDGQGTPGLNFDASLGAVVFAENNTAPVICARLVKHWYGTKLDDTGACGITRAFQTLKIIDDGFQTKTVKYFDVYFGKMSQQRGRRGD